MTDFASKANGITKLGARIARTPTSPICRRSKGIFIARAIGNF